ncbi:MAG: NADH-quinone oxidoreductase subunit N [Myxococcota bacterium]
MTPPDLNFAVIGPIVWASIGALLVLLGEVLLSRTKTFMGRSVSDSYIGSLLAVVAMLTLSAATYMAGSLAVSGETLAFNPDNPMLQLDRYSALFTGVLGLAALLSCALSMHYLDELRIHHGEFYALVLFSTAGMMLLVAAVDLLPVFLGLELMSIPIYVLAGFDRGRLRSNESALKYFLLGSFATAVMLYGMALLYGAAGGTGFVEIRSAMEGGGTLATLGLALLVVGFAFKVSSVPFHQWTPDVYEGAPSAVTAFMSVTVKLAAFAALLRILVVGIGGAGEVLGPVLWVMAALTMLVGNLMAVIQENVKRMLAYSSIAHAGYLLIGFVAGTAQAQAAIVFYLVSYVFMNLGAFGVVVALAHRGRECEHLDDFTGLAHTRPGLAALMALFLLSLAGIPGTAGFMAKWQLFTAAVSTGHLVLALIGVLMSVVSVYYYLRIAVRMYMHEPGEAPPRVALGSGEALVLTVCSVAVVYLGVFPNGAPVGADLPVLDWARASAAALAGVAQP